MMKVFKDAPKPIALLALSMACPTELSLFLGGMRLPPHRVALIILLIMAIVRLARAKPIQLMACDGVFLLYGLWQIGVFMSHEGQGPGLQYGGSLALESFVSYFIARIYVTNAEQLRATVSLLVLCVLVVGAFAVVEAVSHTLVVHPFLKQLTGHDVEPGFELRNGLMRAYSTFDHPILYGSFCASVLALAWATAKRIGQARRNAALIAVATYFGLSSAPLLCIGVQTGLLIWERLSRGIPRRAVVTVSGVLTAMFGLGIVSDRSPFAIIATGFTLDPWTGYYRLLIWQHGLDNVARSPLYGIGLGDWTREWWMHSDSVDAFWLVIMMRMGIPALVLLILALTLLMVAIHQQRVGMSKEIRSLVIAWTFSVIALSLAGCTVHYWNNLHAYFFFLTGLMAWVGDAKLAKARARAMARAAAAKSPDGAPALVPSRPRPPWAAPSGAPPSWAIARTPLPLPPPSFAGADAQRPGVPNRPGSGPQEDRLHRPLAVGAYAVV